MTHEIHRFSLAEQAEFDRFFPPEKVQEFEENGIDDWINMFDALETFDFKIQPEGKDAVLNMFLNHRLASQITKKETENGIFVYRRNITPLLKASIDIFWKSSDYWTKDLKQAFNNVFSKKTAASNAERDWTR